MFGCRTILMIWSSRFLRTKVRQYVKLTAHNKQRKCQARSIKPGCLWLGNDHRRFHGQRETNLKPLVLKHALDGGILVGGCEFRLENDTKGAIANNFALGVLQVSRFASHAVLDFLTNDFCGKSEAKGQQSLQQVPPRPRWLPYSSLSLLTSHSEIAEAGWPILRHRQGRAVLTAAATDDEKAELNSC